MGTVKIIPTMVYSSLATVLGDVFMMALLAWLAVGEILNILKKYRKGRLRTYLKPDRLLNWAVFVQGCGLVAFFAILTRKLDDLEGDIRAVPSPPSGVSYTPGSNAWHARHEKLNVLFDSMTNLTELLTAAELVTFWYIMVIVCKFFEAFSANPRLAVLTRTFLTA